MYPERFSHLPEYAFPRLRALLDGHNFVGPQYNMTIGEPQHLYPLWIKDVLLDHIDGFNRYPANDGIEKLQTSIVDWFYKRFGYVGVRSESEFRTQYAYTRKGTFQSLMLYG